MMKARSGKLFARSGQLNVTVKSQFVFPSFVRDMTSTCYTCDGPYKQKDQWKHGYGKCNECRFCGARFGLGNDSSDSDYSHLESDDGGFIFEERERHEGTSQYKNLVATCMHKNQPVDEKWDKQAHELGLVKKMASGSRARVDSLVNLPQELSVSDAFINTEAYKLATTIRDAGGVEAQRQLEQLCTVKALAVEIAQLWCYETQEWQKNKWELFRKSVAELPTEYQKHLAPEMNAIETVLKTTGWYQH